MCGISNKWPKIIREKDDLKPYFHENVKKTKRFGSLIIERTHPQCSWGRLALCYPNFILFIVYCLDSLSPGYVTSTNISIIYYFPILNDTVSILIQFKWWYWRWESLLLLCKSFNYSKNHTFQSHYYFCIKTLSIIIKFMQWIAP